MGTNGALQPVGMRLPDLRGKRLLVPVVYFSVLGDEYYVTHVRGWITFNQLGKDVRGYSLFYPIDKKRGYMIEDEAHSFYDDGTS